MEHHNHQATARTTASSSPMKWAGICLAVGAVLITLITVFKVPVSTVVTGAIFLACPLMHVLMMRDGKHKH